MDDEGLARRSLRAFGEVLACQGPSFGGRALRDERMRGVRNAAQEHNHWLDAAVVLDPCGLVKNAGSAVSELEKDGVAIASLPHCLWATDAHIRGHTELESLRSVCMSMPLCGFNANDVLAALPAGVSHHTPSLAEVAAVNERAQNFEAGFLGGLRWAEGDHRIRTHGLRVDSVCVAVAIAFDLDKDTGVHFVATLPEHQRRGYASLVVRLALAFAAERSMESTTLQTSPTYLSLYARLGYRPVVTLRAHVRASAAFKEDGIGSEA